MSPDQLVLSVRRWPGMRSEYCRLPPDPGATTRTKAHQIGVSFSRHSRVVFESGGDASYLAIPAGAVFANGPEEIRWTEVAEPTEALEIFPDLAYLDATVEPSRPGPVEIMPARATRDATVLGLAAVIRRAHLGQTEPDTLHASTLVHRLIAHLADHYCHPRPRPVPRSGRLDRGLVDRVADLVEERLAEPLRLEDLAAQAHLSPYHFARAFKRTTGLAPHEYVTMRRIERAKTLLRSGRGSVPGIARTLGYHNVSHFRRLFRHHTGYLPSQLRQR